MATAYVSEKKNVPAGTAGRVRVTLGDRVYALVILAIWLVAVGVISSFFLFLSMLALPWRGVRIQLGNIYGTVLGRTMLAILGSKVFIKGLHYMPYGEQRSKPVIICLNHCSQLDVVLTMWLTPNKTVGIAKKEIIFTPFFGLVYWLAGHLLVDRSNHEKATASMAKACEYMKTMGMSTVIFPEGTRSADGRLLPFKKGAVHLAIQTGFPILPVVLTGTHRGWPRKNPLLVTQYPLGVNILPPIDTTGWQVDTVDEHVETIYKVFYEHLPEEQRPHKYQPVQEQHRPGSAKSSH